MIPISLTFYITKLLQFVVQRLGKGGGTALPGVIALRLNKKLLPILARQLGGTIVVSGTNGKTTTARLIASFLEGSGHSLVHNRSGSNLTRGILSTLIANAHWNRRIQADWGIFEVDEAVFDEVVSLLQPNYVIATNLFRDQLDRYGEVTLLADKWRKACQELSESSSLIINADDPLIASLALHTKAKVVPFGVETGRKNASGKKLANHADSRRCPVCGGALVFTRVNYSHLGEYVCVNKDFSHPEPALVAKNISLKGMSGSEFRIHTSAGELSLELGLAGLYNVYNSVAAVSVAAEMNLDAELIQNRVRSFKAVFGRLEQVSLGETELVLILVKNPTGFNQVIQTLNSDPEANNFWLLLNDKYADGRDISWIWDVELEKLSDQTNQVVIGGTRAHDMALRAKYAGYDMSGVSVSPSLADGLRVVSSMRQPTVYCLCTYTAMLGLRQLLQKQYKLNSYHAD